MISHSSTFQSQSSFNLDSSLCSVTSSNSFNSRKLKFRLNAKRLLLTYPKLAGKHLVLRELKKTLQIEDYLIAQEHHKDSSSHIHALIILKKRINLKNPKRLRIRRFGKYYSGNYQGVKSLRKTFNYLLKENDFILSKDFTQQGSTRFHRNQLLLYAAQNPLDFKLQMSLFDYNQLPKSTQVKKEGILEFSGLRLEYPCYSLKKRHVYIYGPPGTGKTHFLTTIKAQIICLRHNHHPKLDFDQKFLAVDEFFGCRIQMLNQLADGTYPLNIKYIDPVYSGTFLAVIICSNYPPGKFFNGLDFELFEARFNVVSSLETDLFRII